jgi:hypothetical protein
MLLGLNGEVLSRLGEETPLERLRREANEVVDLLPALEKEAFNRRLIFGPFDYAKFTSGRYSLEYSFNENEAVPYLLGVFKDNGIYSNDFVEYMLTVGKARTQGLEDPTIRIVKNDAVATKRTDKHNGNVLNYQRKPTAKIKKRKA